MGNSASINKHKYEFLAEYTEKCRAGVITDKDTSTAYRYLKDLVLMMLRHHYISYVKQYGVDMEEIAHDVATYALEKVWSGKEVKNWNGYLYYATRHFLYGKAYKKNNYVRWHDFSSVADYTTSMPDTDNIRIDQSEIIGTNLFPMLYVSLAYGVKGERIFPKISLYKKPINFIINNDGGRELINSIKNSFRDNSAFVLYLFLEYAVFSKALTNSQLWLLFNYPGLFFDSIRLSGDRQTRYNAMSILRKVILFYYTINGDYSKVLDLASRFGLKKVLVSVLVEFREFLKYLSDHDRKLADQFRENLRAEINGCVRKTLIDSFSELLLEAKTMVEKFTEELKSINKERKE